jgi:hypothetical protein
MRGWNASNTLSPHILVATAAVRYPLRAGHSLLCEDVLMESGVTDLSS